MDGTKLKESARAAFPIMLGYVAIGLACGILSSSIGMDAVQVLIMSWFFYSGAGQFMLPNMWLAGAPIASIVASISLVNTRQILYSATLAPKCRGVGKKLSFLFAATVTDESFGVNMAKFADESAAWTVEHATAVNMLSQASWTISAVVGVILGNAVGIPVAIASFAMTSIFICLMVTQRIDAANVVAMAVAMVGVYLCKLLGLSGAAILVGALLGVVAAMLYSRVSGGSDEDGSGSAGEDDAEEADGACRAEDVRGLEDAVDAAAPDAAGAVDPDVIPGTTAVVDCGFPDDAMGGGR